MEHGGQDFCRARRSAPAIRRGYGEVSLNQRESLVMVALLHHHFEQDHEGVEVVLSVRCLAPTSLLGISSASAAPSCQELFLLPADRRAL
eukprot:664318-Hanusia_phi.AAC.1